MYLYDQAHLAAAAAAQQWTHINNQHYHMDTDRCFMHKTQVEISLTNLGDPDRKTLRHQT